MISSALARRLVWLLVVAFVVAGIYLAWTYRYEDWAGQALERAAPAARRVLSAPAKQVLRETREHLPIYGEASTWVVRKSASIVYFGMVGLFVLVLRKRRPGSLKETLLVTVAAGVGMSTIVEVLEWPEAFGSEMFDLGCGAAGGLIAGILAWPRLRGKKAISEEPYRRPPDRER